MGEVKAFGMWYDTYTAEVSTLLENIECPSLSGELRKYFRSS